MTAITAQVAAPPQQETIQRLANTVHLSFAMLAGMQLDVFTPLKDGPLTGDQIAAALGVGPPKLKPLLYALVAAGLLTAEEGDRFANTAEANHFLVRSSPSYAGSVHELWHDLWSAELKTSESIRTGRAQAKHDFSAMTHEKLEAFFRGLHAGTLAAGRMMVARYDFSNMRRLLDVGGGSGGMAIAIAQECPHIEATVVDLPTVTPITERFVAEAGAADRVGVLTADLVRGALTGSYDVAILKAFIQTLSADEARVALRNVGRAMPREGVIYILGRILDNSRLSPPITVAFNLVFINVYDGGQAYTEQEHRDWLAEAGFGDVVRDALPDGTGVIIARKQA